MRRELDSEPRRLKQPCQIAPPIAPAGVHSEIMRAAEDCKGRDLDHEQAAVFQGAMQVSQGGAFVADRAVVEQIEAGAQVVLREAQVIRLSALSF